MFWPILRFELRYYLRRTSTWIYFLIFFAFAFFMVNVAGGAFRGISVTTGGKEFVNSPIAIALWTLSLGLFGVIVTAALLGNAVYRDYETRIHPLFFTTPISERAYLGGRFAGAILANTVVFLSIPLGLIVGSLMPYLERNRFGPMRLDAYLQPFLLFTLPNLLLAGVLFFALAAWTRQMLPNYVGGVLLLVGYSISSELLSDIENQRLASLLDPFGAGAAALSTRYWSIAERNTRLLPLDGPLLANRALWVGLALLGFTVFVARFRFAHMVAERLERKGRRGAAGVAAAVEESGLAPGGPAIHALPEVGRSFGRTAQWAQFRSLARRDFLGIVRNRYFAAIVAAGLAFLILIGREVGKIYGTTTYPVTYTVLDVLGNSWGLFVLIIIVFYAGELIWRDRDLGTSGITDALPVPTWVPFLSKLAALVGTVAVLLGVVMVCGVVTQAAKGYYRFEPGLYVRHLFGIQLVEYATVCVLALALQTLANHKYLGHLLVVLVVVGSSFLPAIGVEHNLAQFGSDGGVTYSDMNGYGHFLGPWAWWKTYWGAFALLLAVTTYLFWVRGRETAWTMRVTLARARFGRTPRMIAAGAGLLWLATGGWIFYNTNVLNDFETGKRQEELRAEYEKRFKRFERTPQPRITSASVQADLFPEIQDARFRGRYALRNKTRSRIDSLHLILRSNPEYRVRRLALDRPNREVLHDREIGYRILRLERPMLPGDSMTLEFDLAYVTRGFGNRTGNTMVVENGTFVNNAVLPSIGYEPDAELGEDDQRKKYGLKPKLRMPDLYDRRARMANYVTDDADWIRFDATVSTAPDQIAIAPGYLQREWREGGRRFFRYTMDAPILNFYSFLSARYAVRRDHWNGVKIEIFYHPGHEWNLDRMVDATKKSLDYYTRNFGPYQHRQVRILEFPRYATFAQSFPNTIPYSEAIGFISRVDRETDIDYPFYVTAHEVGHQWWAHQVIGGNVQGATMLSESMAQYSALMVMEREYGRPRMKRFLKYELDRYLLERSAERRGERPLYRVENQQYIHYQKGSLVTYALRDLLGEIPLNNAIARYVGAVKFTGPPYTYTPELLSYLREATPDSLRYALTDLFETITLYENRTDSASMRPVGGGRYAVELVVNARKMRADSLGNETPVAMNDLVDVGVFAQAARGEKEGRPLYLAKHRLRSGVNRIRVTVDGKPERAGADPLNKLIDRTTDDNTRRVTGK